MRRAGALLGFVPTLLLAAGFWFCLPPRLFDVPYSTVLLDRDGRLLGASIAADVETTLVIDDDYASSRHARLYPGDDGSAFMPASFLYSQTSPPPNIG